jgi:hypothetical protein
MRSNDRYKQEPTHVPMCGPTPALTCAVLRSRAAFWPAAVPAMRACKGGRGAVVKGRATQR